MGMDLTKLDLKPEEDAYQRRHLERLEKRFGDMRPLGGGTVVCAYRTGDYVIRIPRSGEKEEWLREEARVLNRLQELKIPSVPRLIKDHSNEEYPFIVVNFIEGRLLHDFIKDKHPIPYNEAVYIALQGTRFLIVVHIWHIVLRDITAMNFIYNEKTRQLTYFDWNSKDMLPPPMTFGRRDEEKRNDLEWYMGVLYQLFSGDVYSSKLRLENIYRIPEKIRHLFQSYLDGRITSADSLNILLTTELQNLKKEEERKQQLIKESGSISTPPETTEQNVENFAAPKKQLRGGLEPPQEIIPEKPSLTDDIKNEIIRQAISAAEGKLKNDEYWRRLDEILDHLRRKGYSEGELRDLASLGHRTFTKNTLLRSEAEKLKRYKDELEEVVENMRRLVGEGKPIQNELEKANTLKQLIEIVENNIKGFLKM